VNEKALKQINFRTGSSTVSSSPRPSASTTLKELQLYSLDFGAFEVEKTGPWRWPHFCLQCQPLGLKRAHIVRITMFCILNWICIDICRNLRIHCTEM
jgi:hypothetical protein